jgi:hypothetical protein
MNGNNSTTNAATASTPTTNPYFPSSAVTIPSASSTKAISLAGPAPFPTALVATLCSLIPLSVLVGFGFYLYYRRRNSLTDASPPTTRSRDTYVWGPLGLIRKREKDKENPVLKAQEADARNDPIAEAIRQEERERLARMRRTGEARFYAPGVRHLVEQVGSKERMKVIIDWRDRVKMDRPW